MKIVLSVLFFLVCENLFAAYSNYNSILIGDKAAGMGGTAAAVAGDASSCSWYNPATCALLRGKSFSAAVGIYKKFDTIYGDNADLIKAGLTVNQGFFRPLPSSTGSIVRFKDKFQEWTIALSIVTPEYDTFKGDLANSNNSKTNLSLTDESLWVGPSFSRRISKKESAGISLYYTARSFTKSLSDRTFVSSTQTKIYQEEKALTQNSVVAVLGYYYQQTEKLSWGASVRLPSYHVAGNATYFENTLDSGTTVSTKNLSQLGARTKIPARYTLGFSYEEKNSITMAFDMSYFGRENYSDVDSVEAGVAEDITHNGIWNSNFGMEFYFIKNLKMRFGVFTNFSAHPEPDLNKVRGQGDRIDQLGWSSNIAFQQGPITYTFGGYYVGGRGKSAQRINQELQIIPKTQQVFTMLVGTSFAF